MIVNMPHSEADTFQVDAGWMWSWTGGEILLIYTVPCPYRPNRLAPDETRHPRAECEPVRHPRVDQCQ